MESVFRAGICNAISATFLAMVVACLSRPLACRPAILHCLWLLVLLKLVTPPLYEMPITWDASAVPRDKQDFRAEVFTTLVPTVQEEKQQGDIELVELDFATESRSITPEEHRFGGYFYHWSQTDWMRPLGAIWLSGTGCILLVSLRRIMRFEGLLRNSQPASMAEQGRIDSLARILGLKRGPIFAWVSAKLSPMIWSIGRRPRLIVPRDLWKSLDEPQQSTLIVHELAHLRRGDHRVRYFELGVTALFWWHPMVWWVSHALRDAEEQCCDAWVVWAFPDAARAYAETLLETIDFLDRSKDPELSLASGFGKVHHLRRRLTMILTESTPRRLNRWSSLGLFGLSALLLPINATWAQKAQEPRILDVSFQSLSALNENPRDSAKMQDVDVGTALQLAIRSVNDAPAGQFLVKLSNEGSSNVVFSGSMEQAIEQLKIQTKAIEQKSVLSEQDKKQKDALVLAIESLAKMAQQVKDSESKGMNPVGINGSTIVSDSSSKTKQKRALTAKDKAEIEELQAKIQRLTKDLSEKQPELAEVQAKLSAFGVEHGMTSDRVIPNRGNLVVMTKVGIAEPRNVMTGVSIDNEKRIKQLMEEAFSGYKPGRYAESEKVAAKITVLGPKKESAKALPSKTAQQQNAASVVAIVKDIADVHSKELKGENAINISPPLDLKINQVPVEVEFVTKGDKVTPQAVMTTVITKPRIAVSTEQERIEELEKTLKQLIQEVERLKKEPHGSKVGH